MKAGIAKSRPSLFALSSGSAGGSQGARGCRCGGTLGLVPFPLQFLGLFTETADDVLEVLLLVFGQHRKDRLDHLVLRLLGGRDDRAAHIRDRDDLGAAILRIGLALDQFVALEAVDRFRYRTGREAERAGYVRRALRPLTFQKKQELAAGKRHAFVHHALIHQAAYLMVEFEHALGDFYRATHEGKYRYYEVPCQMITKFFG